MRRSSFFVFVSLIVIALAISGCDEFIVEGRTLVGSGDLITTTYDLEDFDAVDISNAFEATVVQDDAFSVVTRVDDNIMEYLEVFVRGNTLVIQLTPMANLNIVGSTMEAEITMPALSEISLSGASRAAISGFSSEDHFDVELSGASSLEGDIEAGRVTLGTSGASGVMLALIGADVRIDASGSSEVVLSGSGEDAVIGASGASEIDLADFPIGDADIEASGASTVVVNPEGRLDVNASGGSMVRYRGNPTMGSIDTSGGASVTQD
jgi:hypothetical protein